MKAFLTFQHGSRKVGTLKIGLHDDVTPKTVRNFVTFLEKGYKGTRVHRLIKGFMLQAGDITAGDGTGGYSIYGKEFADENFLLSHNGPGRLSMANSGPNTNGSQFFVTFRATPHLDGKHVVFGSVDMRESADVLKQLEQTKTLSNDRPKEELIISDCGLIQDTNEETQQPANVAAVQDEDEIDLDEDGDETKNDAVALDQNEEEIEDDPSKPLSKAEQMKRRLRKLKQKMNQARQLNRQAVKEEGERSSAQGDTKIKNQMTKMAKEAKKAAWMHQNAKALLVAEEAGIDGKYLTQQAVDSVRKSRIRAEKAQLHSFEVTDTHNPEGQHRNYLRDLKSIRRRTQLASVGGTESFDPLQSEVNPEQQREGARLLAEEMHRRVAKSQQKMRKRKNDDEGDVSYINERNKNFNRKISRNYDKHTAEIRDNLERGTAL